MNTQKKENRDLVCNKCGKALKTLDGGAMEGAAIVEVDWGYFSNKDGERHRFCLCEECYDKMAEDFAVPVEVEEKIELF